MVLPTLLLSDPAVSATVAHSKAAVEAGEAEQDSFLLKLLTLKFLYVNVTPHMWWVPHAFMCFFNLYKHIGYLIICEFLKKVENK